MMVSEKVEDNNNVELKTSGPSSEESSNIKDEIAETSTQFCVLIDHIKEQIKNGKLDTSDGISLLDVKNQMMLSYLINLVYVITKQCHGRSIEGDAAIDRLVEIRTVLERIRPLEHKLKYTMEKLVKTARTGVGNENDPTHFRANPDSMMDNMGDSSDASENDESTTAEKKSEKKSGLYVPPRLAPMHYEEENQASRRQKQLERAKKRALHSSVVEELKEEYLDTPTEVSHGNALKATVTRHQKHKNQYEEEYFTRLPSSKKDKHRGRYSMTVGNIADHLTHFEDIQVLEDEESFMRSGKRKRKSAGKANKKKGFKRRRTQ